MPAQIQRQIWAQRVALRNALCAQYQCFLHETAKSQLGSIRQTGLEGRDPGASTDDQLMGELGVKQREIVCLHPLGSTRGVCSSLTPPYVLLAVKNSAVPHHVTLDWSWPGCWSLAPIIEKCGPQRTAEEIFLEIVRRRGSVAGLARIGREHLFILCKGENGSAPERWRPLVQTSEDDIVFYNIAGQPPSVPACPS
jgi:hypothetical protein